MKAIVVLIVLLGLLTFIKSVFASSNVVINEFLANPASGGNEWVELYNPTSSDVNLSGWALSDKSGSKKSLDMLKAIPANGFAVYEYSGDGWLNNSASDSKPESISLFDNNGSAIDSFSYYSDQKESITTGRSPDGSDNWSVLASQTKGSANGNPPDTPTPTPGPTAAPAKIKTPTPSPKPTFPPAKTPAATSAISPTITEGSIIALATPETATDYPTDYPDVLATDSTDVLATQNSNVSPAPSIKPSMAKKQSVNNLPGILIALGLIFFASCGILVFQSPIKNLFKGLSDKQSL